MPYVLMLPIQQQYSLDQQYKGAVEHEVEEDEGGDDEDDDDEDDGSEDVRSVYATLWETIICDIFMLIAACLLTSTSGGSARTT